MGKPATPQPPDPYASAAAQYQYGTEAAGYGQQLNDINTVTPTGTTAFQQTGLGSTGAPITTETTTLSPNEQAILSGEQGAQIGELGAEPQALSAYMAASGHAPNVAPVTTSVPGQTLQTSLNTGNVPGIMNPEQAAQQGTNTALSGELAALSPTLNNQYEQTDASLRNSGITPESNPTAYWNAMGPMLQQQGGELAQAGGNAVTTGNTVGQTLYGESANTNSQLYGEDLSTAQFGNQAKTQQLGADVTAGQFGNQAGGTQLADWAQELGIPLNDIQTLIGNGVNSPSAPSSVAEQVSTPDIMSAFQNNYQGQLNNYNAQIGQQNSLYGDAATLGVLGYLGYAAAAAP